MVLSLGLETGCSRPRPPRLPNTQVSSQFRGDAEGLVDMLIAACEMKPQAIPQLEGRELVKWSDDGCCSGSALLDMPLEISSIRCGTRTVEG